MVIPGYEKASGGTLDPITHSLAGGALSATGLCRASRLATPTLVVAANAPDIDIVAMFWGPYAALAWRRGLTHGIPALIVLPFVVAGTIVLVDRLAHRVRGLDCPPHRFGTLLGLAAVGVATHPVLDWINTYGMRWFVPFDGSWSYGDAIFILDPWLWLLFGGPVFFAWSRTRVALGGWGLLAGLLSVPVLVASAVPPWARAVWLAGLAGWILLRVDRRHLGGAAREPGRRIARSEGLARRSLLAASAYLVLMVSATPFAEAVAAAEARERLPLDDVVSTMVGPLPADPLGGEVIVETAEAYWIGTFRWMRRPRVEWEAEPIERGEVSAVVSEAMQHPEARDFLEWSRFPLHQVTPHSGGWWVEFHDARYLGSGGGSLSGVRVFIHPDFRSGRDPTPVGEY